MSPGARRGSVVASYVFVGSLLAWSRLVGLRHGYCCDEIRTVTDYIDRGPRTILAGQYIPNDHELFSMVAWGTTRVIAESPLTFRLWSVVPFLLGVALVTTWLHKRTGALSGLLFLLLATASPLLLDITRMARGYGIAFLAMSVLIVGALEAERTGRTAAIGFAIAGGIVGSLTLPHFAIAFGATAVVLLTRADLRTRVLIGTCAALIVISVWWAPHVDDIAGTSLGEYGHRIDAAWLITAPIDQTLVPAMTELDDTFVKPSIASIVAVVVFGVLIASSPLLRRRRTALVLSSGVATTVAVFWLTDTYVVPRFFSFLLVPLFMLVATGSASVLGRLTSRPTLVRTCAVVAAFALLVFESAPLLLDVPRLPRDAGTAAAATINRLVPPTVPVFAHLVYPRDLAFHLGREVNPAFAATSARTVCTSDRLVVYVDQPYLLPAVALPCAGRDGTRHYRFEQYARGGRIDVWIIRPATT